MTDNHYNYEVFPPEDDVDAFRDFPTHLPVRETAPDPELTNLDDGALVRLSAFTRLGPTVVEFGSLT